MISKEQVWYESSAQKGLFFICITATRNSIVSK